MSTTMTATFPNLAYTADAASRSFPGVPTMPVSALAWSQADVAEPVVQPQAVSVAAAGKPRISRVAMVGMLFGGITAVATLGAIALGGNDSSSTPLAVVDHTTSDPSAAPVPMPTVSQVAAPVPVAGVVTVPVVVPPKVAAPAQPIATPPLTETPKPTEHQDRPHWNWPRRIWQHHDQDPKH